MGNYNRFLILDDSFLNSTYIQMFVLGKYNESLFEPVIMDPMVWIYKLKI